MDRQAIHRRNLHTNCQDYVIKLNVRYMHRRTDSDREVKTKGYNIMTYGTDICYLQIVIGGQIKSGNKCKTCQNFLLFLFISTLRIKKHKIYFFLPLLLPNLSSVVGLIVILKNKLQTTHCINSNYVTSRCIYKQGA